MRIYEDWCLENDFLPFYPPDELRLRFYASYRADFVATETIRGDLYGIRWYSIHYGHPIDLKQMYGLQTTMKGIKRYKGVNLPDSRLPVTYNTLRKFAKAVIWNNYDCVVLYTAMVVATFGLLRSGEFAVEAKKRPHNERTLYIHSLQTIYCKNNKNKIDYFLLKLKVSKNDIFRSGVKVPIGHGCGIVDPVNLLEKMLIFRNKLAKNNKKLCLNSNNFLFILSNGTPVSRSDISTMLKALLFKCKIPEPDRYKGHSFRIGGATSLARRGVPSHIIQIMGRWRSDCYKLYIRFTHKQITQLQHNLANLKIKDKNTIFLYHNESRLHPLNHYI